MCFERLTLTEQGLVPVMVAYRAGGETRVVVGMEGVATVSLASSFPNTEHTGGVALDR